MNRVSDLSINIFGLDLADTKTSSQDAIKKGAGQKLGNLGNFGIFFFKIVKSKFSILAVGQNQKLNNFSEISDFSGFSEFSICHFIIFLKKFFSKH